MSGSGIVVDLPVHHLEQGQNWQICAPNAACYAWTSSNKDSAFGASGKER